MNKFIYFFIDSGDNHGGYAEPPPPDYSEVATDRKYKQSQRLYYNSESDTTSDSDYNVHQTRNRSSPQHQRHTSRTRRHRSRSNTGKNSEDNSLHYHDDEVTHNQGHSDDYDKIYYCGGGE